LIWTGKATGYHAEFAAAGAARIRPDATVIKNADRTYTAPLQIFDMSKGEWVDKIRPNGTVQLSTFFPPSWSEARITYEVSEAYKVGQSKGLAGGRFVETTPSGLKVQYSWDIKNQRTTFYPVGR